jgi:mono/diheme cytochrome c family protein
VLNRLVAGLAVLAILGVAGFAALAWRPAIAPIERPAPASFSPAEVARGEILAAGGYCVVCHTAKGGARYAGGYPLQTGFGTIYSTNITPDSATGIGAWSEAAFRRATREGISRDGSQLYPAFPYDHFTKLADADVAALYAYFLTRPPVHATVRANDLPFPLNFRPLLAGWKLLFFRPGRFEPVPARDAQWNRGAYLVEGLSHCGACHTPRNLLGAEKNDQAFAGAVIDNWVAPPLTRANPSPVPWSIDDLRAYLATGISRFHGTAAGPMSPVVHDGLAHLPESDVGAIALYMADLAGGKSAKVPTIIDRALAADASDLDRRYDPDARFYSAACVSCHYNSRTPRPERPELALNSALGLADPTNLIRVTLFGIGAKEGAPRIVMPAFGHGFSDADVARLAAYLRRTRTSLPPWPDLEKKIAQIRAQGAGS